jgi:hypothetical protein
MIPMMLVKDRMLERATGVKKLSAATEKNRNTTRKLTSAMASGN